METAQGLNCTIGPTKFNSHLTRMIRYDLARKFARGCRGYFDCQACFIYFGALLKLISPLELQGRKRKIARFLSRKIYALHREITYFFRICFVISEVDTRNSSGQSFMKAENSARLAISNGPGQNGQHPPQTG